MKAIKMCNVFNKQRSLNLMGSVRHLASKGLVFKEFGDPLRVVKIRESEIPLLGAQDVLVRMQAAPVNPSDINTIQGQYPIQLSLPRIPGNEGVGIVEEIGSYVRGIHPGHKVVFQAPAPGTWREFAVFDRSMLKTVPGYMGSIEAATLTVNPCTAYRMLTDFRPVRKSGLPVIQNGANSACGQSVIQICKAWGVPTVNIVRDRPNINELKSHLQCLGATFVLTEEELKSTTIFEDKLIDQPSLALNCVGGKSSFEMLRHLEPCGSMVTYGEMSREPLTIPSSACIYKNISFHGFWMDAWNDIASDCDKEEMLSEIISLTTENKLVAPAHKTVKLDEFKEALSKSQDSKGFQGFKYILKIS